MENFYITNSMRNIFQGYYDTMDAGYLDKNGLVFVTARDDDVINVAGHRLSTLALENIILSHPEIAMACVISVPDDIKNEVPLCLFVKKEGRKVFFSKTSNLLTFFFHFQMLN